MSKEGYVNDIPSGLWKEANLWSIVWWAEHVGRKGKMIVAY